MSAEIIANQITIKLATAIEGARTRRDEVCSRLVRSDIPSAPANAATAQFARAANVLERFLYGQAAHEVSEETLIDLFDRVGRS